MNQIYSVVQNLIVGVELPMMNLMSQSGSLNHCHIHVSLMGSPYDSEVCGIKCSGREKHHIEICVLQPTMSSTRMVVGDIIRKRSRIFNQCQKGSGRGTSGGKGCAHSEVSSNFRSPPPPFSCPASLPKQPRMSNHLQSYVELLVRPRILV
ncbi:uncharacterized protein [Montipora foliosa]|uniref:uncharacterized protein n=1 Tax=Montipora foliosa TaxID=591990 RepID=UPI0035F18343